MPDRVVLIAGATGVLGRAVAAVFAKSGARLVLAGRRETALLEMSDQLGLADDRAFPVAADLSDVDEVERLIEAVAGRWNGVDILLNSVGGWRGGQRVADSRIEEWDATLDLNLRSAYLVNRAVLPYMVERGWGRIVNVASKAAEVPGARQVAYNVAKAGVVSLTASVAADYRRRGVCANVLLPSIIDTPSNREQMPDADTTRWVAPEELAKLMLFLCSDAGSAINGVSIPVYGRV